MASFLKIQQLESTWGLSLLKTPICFDRLIHLARTYQAEPCRCRAELVEASPQPKTAAHRSSVATHRASVATPRAFWGAPRPIGGSHRPSVGCANWPVGAHRPSGGYPKWQVACHGPPVGCHGRAVATAKAIFNTKKALF
jgi:hypothetical protein